jgi:hypothetical protein
MMKTLPKLGPWGSASIKAEQTVAMPPITRYRRRVFSTRDGVAR